MSRLDRDLRLLAVAILFYALAWGLFLRLLSTYALGLGASGVAIGIMNAIMLLTVTLGNAPGAWAARRFRLKPVITAVWWLSVAAPLCYYFAPTWPWLIPGYVITGLSFSNNPAMKSYVFLKSEARQAAGNFAILYGIFPLGLTVAPLVGGVLADHWGMKTVFLASTALGALSALTVSLIADTPYHSADLPWTLRSLWRRRRFRRYVLFFFIGFLAAYVGQDFVNPYLAQIHGQSFSALGVYSALTAFGTATLTFAMGRLVDLRGPRAGIAGAVAALVVGAVLLLVGTGPVMWGLAALALGGLDAIRYVANAIIGPSFRGVPLAWGYAVFDTAMGVPMMLGALLGGVLFRLWAGLPFIVLGSVAAVLLLSLLVIDKTVDEDAPGGPH